MLASVVDGDWVWGLVVKSVGLVGLVGLVDCIDTVVGVEFSVVITVVDEGFSSQVTKIKIFLHKT